MHNELLEPFQRLVEQVSTSEAVRRAEIADGDPAIWRALIESGFVDALVPEAEGGVGLSPQDIAPLLIAAGRHMLPAPFAETMVARALAATAGAPVTGGGAVLLWPLDATGSPVSLLPPVSWGAQLALVQQGGTASLHPVVAGARDGFGFVLAELAADVAPVATFDLPEDAVLHWSVAASAAAMAGAMGAVLDMSIGFVNERQQFGRPLGKFQAIQQQISVMAERVATANLAAQVALARPLPGPTALDAAVAKTVIDAGASVVCAGAHAAFGAIGITAEHDLPLLTRRLKRAQLMYGGPLPWATMLGQAHLATPNDTTVDFIRSLRAS